MFDSDLISGVDVPEGLILRPLAASDYDHGFLKLLSQLTSVGEVSREKFTERFNSMKNTNPKAYYVVVLEEKSTNQIVGAATLVIEWKFIHEASSRGRVEDVVVDESQRGKKLGQLLNVVLVQLAKKLGVYKLSLECKDKLIPFYSKFGYKLDDGNNFLVQRFD